MFSLILESISNFILGVIGWSGYAGVFLLMTLQSLNIPLPSEVIMPFSGFLVSAGAMNFWFTVLAGASGNLAGSLLSYKFADALLKNGYYEKNFILRIIISSKNIRAAENWFKKYGSASIFIGRMVPVVSTFISFPAGLAKMNMWSFAGLTLAGSLVWSGFLTWLGLKFGENWRALRVYFEKFDYLIFVLIIAGIALWIWHRFWNNRGERGSDKELRIIDNKE